MQYHLIALVAAIALSLSACKDDPKPETGDGGVLDQVAASTMAEQAAEEAAAAAESAAAALPQPDPDKPLSGYPELTSGNQIMFLYVAASKLPPDYSELAERFSSEYRGTDDSFRRKDLLKAITPQLDQKIAEATASPYAWMEVEDASLRAYDFDRGGFPVGEFSGRGSRYFFDNPEYRIGWANPGQVDFAPVGDEAAARKIEAMRNAYGNTPRLKVYFFAQSADLSEQKVNALVTAVQIVDKSGRVLAEYRPNAGGAK